MIIGLTIINQFFMKENTLHSPLNQILATFLHSYIVYKGYHWNFKGKSFHQYHKLLDEHAALIYENIDEVAERIRQLDGVSEGRFPEYTKLSQLKITETNDVHERDLDKHLTTLLTLHTTNISLIEGTIKLAEKEDDVGTADMLTSMLEDHQKMRWMIKSSLGE